MARQNRATAEAPVEVLEGQTDIAESVANNTEAPDDIKAAFAEATSTQDSDRPKVDKGMRPLFNEIARLSATLTLARSACYEGDPGKALRALQRLGRQVPDAVELAELIMPATE